jgi:hypothetical protein
MVEFHFSAIYRILVVHSTLAPTVSALEQSHLHPELWYLQLSRLLLAWIIAISKLCGLMVRGRNVGRW